MYLKLEYVQFNQAKHLQLINYTIYRLIWDVWVDFMLVSQLDEQHYLQSGNLVQSGILLTQIINFKSYLVSRVDTHSI